MKSVELKNLTYSFVTDNEIRELPIGEGGMFIFEETHFWAWLREFTKFFGEEGILTNEDGKWKITDNIRFDKYKANIIKEKTKNNYGE